VRLIALPPVFGRTGVLEDAAVTNGDQDAVTRRNADRLAVADGR
jgi:hypothetical protein